ncbi:Glycoside hydrolase, superfamily [Penicillium occitanis (nom. inval.)]|nr:hypothetical protein PENOC_023710 [Penicillium occitanis (nom. inval.)]PCH09348.1 Glycoside hydrolase, superfamily [Penicillium occitanis (nom. inval.)]
MLVLGNFSDVAYTSNPHAPIRWVNQWDNLDRSIKRGYGGASIFFENGVIVANLTRAAEYTCLLASIGLNAIVVSNVNPDLSLLTPENVQGLGKIADVFRPYGVQLGISLDFATPQKIGGLSTYDPLDSEVIKFWANITNQLYEAVPNMASYLVMADSEGQPGPLIYNHTHSKDANLFANALKPYSGILIFPCFCV